MASGSCVTRLRYLLTYLRLSERLSIGRSRQPVWTLDCVYQNSTIDGFPGGHK